MKKVIELQNIKRDFQVGEETVHALRGVSFTINEGEFVTIMGTSGSGKSTLLNTLGCLDTPTSGEYLLDGISVRTMSKPQRAVLRNRKIGFVFQSYNLIPHQTVLANVELALTISGVSKEVRRKKAIAALEKVGLGKQLHKRPSQMSGGQMQRVAIARALVNDPEILLADEPTSMIDACSRATILDMLLKLRDEINMTIIFITHDIGLAYYVSDNVYIMEHGKFVESGPAEEVILHPTAAYTKRLISDVPKIYEPWDLTTV